MAHVEHEVSGHRKASDPYSTAGFMVGGGGGALTPGPPQIETECTLASLTSPEDILYA
jgi:hypothetical protein